MTSIPYPLRTGIAFAVTVGIGYAACGLVFWLWPQAAAGFMNALFHGLDFSPLQQDAAAFRFDGFVYALVGMMVWAFALGALFGWLSSVLAAAPWTARTAAAVLDPVCAMSVDPAKAAGKHEYQGMTYHFCSERCLATFKTDPARFAQGQKGGPPLAHA